MLDTIGLVVLIVVTVLIACDISRRLTNHARSVFKYKRTVDNTTAWMLIVLNKCVIDKSVIGTAFLNKVNINKVAMVVQENYTVVFKRLSEALDLPVDPSLILLVRSKESSYKENGVYTYTNVWMLTIRSEVPDISQVVSIGSDDELREMAGNLTCMVHADEDKVKEMAEVIKNRVNETQGM